MPITHTKVSLAANSTDPNLIQPSDWNASHLIAGTVDFSGANVTGLNLGVVPRAVTGTSDTILASDRSNYVTYNNSNAVAITLPAAGSFGNNFSTSIKNLGLGLLTVTPVTSTIDGTSSLLVSTGDSCTLYSDNVNYFSRCIVTANRASIPADKYCNGSTDVGVCVNNAIAALPVYPLGGGIFAAVGTVSLVGFNGVVQSYATTITIPSPFVRLQGLAGLTYTGSGDAIRVQMANIGAWFANTNSGGLVSLNIGGTSAAASCVHIGDVRGFDMYDVVCHDFTNGTGFWFDNVTAVTERVNTYKILSSNNKKAYRFTNTGGGSAQSSFGNSNLMGLHGITNSGQTCLSIESGLLYHEHIELNCNMSGGDNFLTISGLQYTAGPAAIITTSQLKLHVESSGTSTGITCGGTNSIDYEGMIDELSSPGTITDAITGSCFVRGQSSYFTGYGTLGNEGANIWGFRNGTSPVATCVYNTFSGAGANAERMCMDWITNPNTARLSTLAAGTGAVRALEFAPGGVAGWQVAASTLQLLPSTDNAKDLGLSTFRPRDIYVARAIRTGQTGNTDLAGILSFSAATTASYTFAGTYATAPVCIIAPIAPGGTTFSITTDSTTTLTVTASGAFTGSVNYTCVPRT